MDAESASADALAGERAEVGEAINGARALEIFARANWWLQDKLSQRDLDGTPTATCGCGACSLCAYRYFESLVTGDQYLIRVADENYLAGRKHGKEEALAALAADALREKANEAQ